MTAHEDAPYVVSGSTLLTMNDGTLKPVWFAAVRYPGLARIMIADRPNAAVPPIETSEPRELAFIDRIVDRLRRGSSED